MDLSLDFQFNFISLCVFAMLAPRCCCCLVTKSCPTLQSHGQNGLQPARILCQWDFPGKNTRVSCHSLLQGILQTQGSNPHLPVLYCWHTGEVHVSTLLSWLSPYCLDYHHFVVSFEIEMSETSNFVLSLDCFGYPGSFIFPYEF